MRGRSEVYVGYGRYFVYVKVTGIVKTGSSVCGFMINKGDCNNGDLGIYFPLENAVEFLSKYEAENAKVYKRHGNLFIKGKNCNLSNTVASLSLQEVTRMLKSSNKKVATLDTKGLEGAAAKAPKVVKAVKVNEPPKVITKEAVSSKPVKLELVKPGFNSAKKEFVGKSEEIIYTGLNTGRILTRNDRPNLEIVNSALDEIHKKGIKIDLELNTNIINTMAEQWDNNYRILEGLTMDGIGLQSRKDIFYVFSEIYDCDRFKKITKKGNASFDKEVLDRIEDAELGEASSVAALIKNLRSNRALINKLLEFDRYSDENGYVYPNWSYGETYRVSFSEPGLSNISENIRSVVVAPEGYLLCKIDYSQQEPYIMISWLEINELKKLILEYDDFYTALAIFLLEKKINEDVRSKFKTAWLATSYGASIPTISRQIGKDNAKIFFDAYNVKLPQIGKLQDDIKRRIARGDYSCESYFGRERNIDYRGGYTGRAMLNNPIQMTGSDILSFAIEDIQRYKEVNNLGDDILRIYWTVHDEIILLVKKGYEEHCKNIAKTICYRVDNWIPFKVKVTFCKNY